MVDFPIPGSPPINVTLPITMPPPSTRSNSLIPVTMRLFSSVVLIFFNLCGVSVVCPGTRAALLRAEVVLAGSATTSSVMVFHAPQDGHRPSQRGLVSPHWVHTYTVFSLSLGMTASSTYKLFLLYPIFAIPARKSTDDLKIFLYSQKSRSNLHILQTLPALFLQHHFVIHFLTLFNHNAGTQCFFAQSHLGIGNLFSIHQNTALLHELTCLTRSEERRVGKEWRAQVWV